MALEKIIIADDEPYVLKICRRILSEKYQVKVVRSGLEAIQVIQEEYFDLLLTDIKMPGMDGLETAREVKKINPEIICVTMTGYSTMDTAIKALRLGIDEFVIKPFSPDELTLAVERALEKERLRKENIRLRSLLPLFEFNKSLMSTVDTTLLLQQVLDLAAQETNAAHVILYLVDETGALSHLTHREIEADYFKHFQAGGPILVEMIQKGQIQIHLDQSEEATGKATGSDEDYDALKRLLHMLQVQSLVATPLLGKERLQGVLLITKQAEGVSQSERSFLSVMSSQAAIAYENARLFEDLQQAYDELKTLDHMKSEFTNRAAHELRTPLAILMGYAGILEEDIIETVHQNYMKKIIRNAMRLRSLIDDLLNMRYINAGQLPIIISEIDVDQIIEQVLQDIAILADQKNILIRSKINEPLPVIQSDGKKIELTLMNLLANAIKFTPAEGQIWIDGRVNGEMIEIEVMDTGIGISKEEHAKIFDSFYQIEPSLNRKYDGIGLGLSISKGMVERCGGKIWVESEVGQGSKFIFTIPLQLSAKMMDRN